VGRLYASAVWTGSEVIYWGGEDNSYLPTKKPNGAYNPTTDSWRLISGANGPSAREWVTPVWAGTEMIIWGGADTTSNYNSPPILNDAYAYNPLTDTWRTVSSEGAPSPRIEVISAWTGSELLIWGGTADSNSIYVFDANRVYLKSGAAYNPATDTWRPMATAGAPSQGVPITSAWTGTELLVWHSFKGEGAAYNPNTDSWRPMDSRGPLLQHGGCGTWTGKYFVVCGDEVEPQGELYDPAEDRWHLMESQFVDTGPGPWDGGKGYRYNGSAFIFGGLISGNFIASDLWGYRYVIPSDSADAQP
jgi:N-acetylneuraminic acid mutarotase